MLALCKCESSDLWLTTFKPSPQYCIFSDPRYLSSENVSYEMWFVSEKERPMLGALVMEPSNPTFKAPYSCSLYQGIALLADNSVIHRDVKRSVDAVTFLLEELSKIYGRLSFCLHPKFRDLRALQWFNYHSPEQGQFSIELFYTGIVRTSAYHTFEEYFASTRRVRQSEFRKAKRNGLEACPSRDIEAFKRLYALTFERQGITLSPEQFRVATDLARSSLDGGFGRMLFCRDGAGEVLSATLFLHDDRTAYYMFGATDPKYRNTGASSYLVYENIRHFFDAGVSEIDMVGINSPNRGDFKVSFNAIPTPYFTATWERGQPIPTSRDAEPDSMGIALTRADPT